MSFSFSLCDFKCDRVRDRWWHELRFRFISRSQCVLCLTVSIILLHFLFVVSCIYSIDNVVQIDSRFIYGICICDYGLLICSRMSFKCDIDDNYEENLSDSSTFFSAEIDKPLTYLNFFFSSFFFIPSQNVQYVNKLKKEKKKKIVIFIQDLKKWCKMTRT